MPEGYTLRARGVWGQLPLMGISALGVFLSAAFVLRLASDPGPNTAWGIATCGVMVGIISLLSLWGLKTAVLRSVAEWHIGPDGLTARFMGMTRRVPWRRVYDVRRCGLTLFVDIGDQTLELGIPADLANDEMGAISEFWSCRRARGVPLVLQSFLGTRTWLGAAVIMLAIAGFWLLFASRSDAAAGTVWAAAVLSTLALASLCRAMALVTERIAIGSGHVERSTCFGHVMIPLEEVRLLTHRRPALRAEPPRRRVWIEWEKLMLAREEGMSLLVPPGLAPSSGPRRTPGRICAASGKSGISFNTEAYPFDLFLPDLMTACSQAAVLDDWTGEVFPPRDTDSVQVGRSAAAFCRRARRRYIALGLFQIVCLPGVWILWIAAFCGGTIFFNCMPCTFATAIGNLRKAANVKRTCTRFGDV